MIAYIARHRNRFGVQAICCILCATERGSVTSRGYRTAKRRPASSRTIRDEALTGEILRIHVENYSVYGYRKTYHAMRRAGWDIGLSFDECSWSLRDTPRPNGFHHEPSWWA